MLLTVFYRGGCVVGINRSRASDARFRATLDKGRYTKGDGKMEIGIEWVKEMEAFRLYNKQKPEETYCYKETVWEVTIAISALLRGVKP